jgi:RNA polymerase sigma factor (sigma-70 family)
MTKSQLLEITYGSSRTLPDSTELETLPLPQLLEECQEHLGRFRLGQPNDPRFCLELFRRAIDEQDPLAWQCLFKLYRQLLVDRLQRQGIEHELAEDAVQEAFFTLWNKSASGSVSARDHSLAQVLHYLWGSVRFALIKLRRQQRDIPLVTENYSYAPLTTNDSEAVNVVVDARGVLARVRALVTPFEWQILWLRFGQERPPREIAKALCIPVAEIHATLASAKRRLRNDPQLQKFMDGYS